MDIPSRFQQALARARARRTDSCRPLRLRLAQDGAEVEFELTDADRLGVMASQIRVSRRASGSDPEALVRQAQEMIRRVTYLQESLALIELERARPRAVVRSANPRVDARGLQYWEVVLEEGRSAGLKRYRYDRTGHCRRVEPANLSTETAARLADDLLDLFSAR